MEDHKPLQKSKRYRKGELDNIFRWLGVFVYSSKRFRIQESK